MIKSKHITDDRIKAIEKGEELMGRRASKATENIYYLARCKAAHENEAFTSREKAAAILGIERSRLARIELDKITPYSEEVVIMAKAYNAPYLYANYCDFTCPIGILQRKQKESPFMPKEESLERLALGFLSSSQRIDDISKSLVNISKDGQITENEFESFHEVLQAMAEISENIKAIKDWISSNPTLKKQFAKDLLDT